jgi:hypothetical protein
MLVHDPAKNALALDQWQRPEIPSIEHQAIESIKNRITTSAQKFIELRSAILVEHHDFSVEDCFTVQG